MSDARTLHERLAAQLLDDVLTIPGAASVFAQWRRRFKDNDYDLTYVAHIGQTPRDPADWPLDQVAAFTAVHAGIMSGKYAHVEVAVGTTPGPDADRTGNAQKLNDVHPRFRAYLDMDQNGAASDGTLTWDQTITLNKSSGLGLIADCGTFPIDMAAHVDAHQVPLEVGYTKPSRTYLHLLEEGGVARWAYDADRILVLLNMERMWGSERSIELAA